MKYGFDFLCELGGLDSVGTIMDTFPIVLAAWISIAAFFAVRSFVVVKGNLRMRKVRLVAFGTALVILSLGQAVAFYIVNNVDIALPKTLYAEGYSRREFNKVRIGDAESTVYRLIGDPLQTSTNSGKVLLFFSSPQRGVTRSYWVRCVYLDEKSRTVLGKVASFHTGI